MDERTSAGGDATGGGGGVGARENGNFPPKSSSPASESFSLTGNSARSEDCDAHAKELEEAELEGDRRIPTTSETTATAIGLIVGEEERARPVEGGRSLYHSIQQLSLPSSRSVGGCSVPDHSTKQVPCRLYKPAEFVSSQPEEKDGRQTGDRRTRTRTWSRSRTFPNPESRYNGLDLRKREGGGGGGGIGEGGAKEDLFEEEEHEFFESSSSGGVRDVTDCSDDLSSDVEMSKDGNQTESEEEEEEVEDSVEVRIEAKRARVESIIKTMTTPSDFCSVHQFPGGRDGGCEAGKRNEQTTEEPRRQKRKQYVPQQVDPRSINGGGGGGGGGRGVWPPAPKICIRERSSGLQEMEEELRKMQRKYRRLLDRRDHEISSRSSGEENEGQGRTDFAKWFHFGVSDASRLDVNDANENLRRDDVSSWYDVINTDVRKTNGVAAGGMEHLASVLKAEITKEVDRLVDILFAPLMARNFRAEEARPEVKEEEEEEDRAVRRGDTSGRVRSTSDVIISNGNGRQAESESGSDDGIKEERIKEDLWETVTPEVDEAPFPVREAAKFPTPTPPDPNCLRSANRRSIGEPGADIVSRLTSLPCQQQQQQRLPIHFFPVRGSDGGGRGGPSVVPGMHCFNSMATNRGPFGLTSPPPPPPPPPSSLPLFRSAHPTPPGLYYLPCFSKFSQNHFLKKKEEEEEREQVEPLSLIVGTQKKPKRTKVIDRISPRAVKVTSVEETGAQPGERHLHPIRSDSPPGGNALAAAFHHRYLLHAAGTALHDAFPSHRSLLPFGLAASSSSSPGGPLALHNSSHHHHPHYHHHHSKFIEALYAQMSTVSQRPDQGPASPLDHTAAASADDDDDDDIDDDSKNLRKSNDYDAMTSHEAMMTMTTGYNFTSTLTPMHLRKAKLMFFYVRYPSSSILKVYFPDVKFNKNNTAQLVKWFSNFREFYYIQMEKYARQALAEGVKSAKDVVVTSDSELHRILVVHYNRNCQTEVPENFRFVVQATLREFFTSIAAGKDQEPSWKKAIYKVIQRMDDPVPDYFKSPNWMEKLVDG